jgi:nitrate reductase NapE component
MSLLNSVVAAATETHLTAPTWIFPLVAATIFVALGFILWSFRDVANRHSDKVGGGAGHH